MKKRDCKKVSIDTEDGEAVVLHSLFSFFTSRCGDLFHMIEREMNFIERLDDI